MNITKKYNTNLHLLMGVGTSKTQMERNAKSQTTGKNILMGVSLSKTLWNHLEWDSSLHTIGFKKVQYRQGNPDPNTQYLAKARYHSYAFSFQNELGYVFKLKKGFSLKPSLGLQIGFSRRSKFSEKNAGNFAQSYRPSIERGGELFTGLGLRKNWKSETYDGKITLVYEIGQKSGNGKSKSTVYGPSAPNGVTFSGNKPGRLTHYLHLYGSLLNLKTNWKIVPGLTATLQSRQKSLTTTLKLEYRF